MNQQVTQQVAKSEILRSLGFTKNGEKSTNPERVMRFPIFALEFYYTHDQHTRAHDEQGYIWSFAAVVDLTLYGFNLPKPR